MSTSIVLLVKETFSRIVEVFYSRSIALNDRYFLDKGAYIYFIVDSCWLQFNKIDAATLMTMVKPLPAADDDDDEDMPLVINCCFFIIAAFLSRNF